MTSKALEAAVARAHEIGWSRFAHADAAEIIRAFGQNISEEAVHLRGIDYCRACDRHMTGDLFGVEAVRAAIEKDLE